MGPIFIESKGVDLGVDAFSSLVTKVYYFRLHFKLCYNFY